MTTTDTILVLSDIEKIRNRPGMYIGDNDKIGLATIVREVIDNAVDEYPNYPDKAKPIEVILHVDNSVTVRDYGRGISPYESKNNPGKIEERLAYTLMGSGGKFKQNREQTGNRFAGGLHGVGATATNAMSEYFDVTIYKDGRIFHDRFEYSEPVVELNGDQLPSIKQDGTITTGTKITYKPTTRYMRTTDIDVAQLEQYFQQVAYLNPKLTILFTNERDNEDTITYYSETGILEYMDDLTIDEDGVQVPFVIKPFIVEGEMSANVMNETVHMEATIATAFTKNDTFAARTFTNGVYNSAGGTHLKGYYQGVIQMIRHYYDEFETEINAKYKRQLDMIQQVRKLQSTSDVISLIKPRDISRKTFVIIDFKHEDPMLTPQTKDTLSSPEARAAVAEMFYDRSLMYLDRQISAVQSLIGYLIVDLYEKAKGESAVIKLSKVEAKKLLSTKLAGTTKRDPSRNELFVVEGDSAAGGAKSERDPSFQAILPLRGKILNANRTTVDKLLANPELLTLFTALGTGIGSNYDDTKRNYDKLIIATDQDDDGSHIQVLLLTLIILCIPQFLLDGHVYYLDTPLYVNVMKGKQSDVYTYSEDEQQEFLQNRIGNLEEVQRNKGLGELTKEQVIETMLTPETRRITQLVVNDEDELYALIEELMGPNVAGRKRLFIES